MSDLDCLGKKAVDESSAQPCSSSNGFFVAASHGTDGGKGSEQPRCFSSWSLARTKSSHVVARFRAFHRTHASWGGPSGDSQANAIVGEESPSMSAVDDAEFRAILRLRVASYTFWTVLRRGEPREGAACRRAGIRAELYFRWADLCGERETR